MKKKFYVFLDIDGVLFDWDYIKSLSEEHHGGIMTSFHPDSISALNYFLAQLSIAYDVELVISSTWRSNMNYTMNVLVENGLKTNDIFVSKTEMSATPHYRGKEILNYLQNKKDKENYAIIDDELFDYKKYFDFKRIIKTDIFKESLRKHMIDDFFKRNNMSLRKINKW